MWYKNWRFVQKHGFRTGTLPVEFYIYICSGVKIETSFLDTLSYVYWWGCGFIFLWAHHYCNRGCPDQGQVSGSGNWQLETLGLSVALMSLVYLLLLLLIIDDKLGESFYCCLGNGPERPSPLRPCPVLIMHLSLIPRKQKLLQNAHFLITFCPGCDNVWVNRRICIWKFGNPPKHGTRCISHMNGENRPLATDESVEFEI